MSRTWLHVGKGLWNNGNHDIMIPEIRKYLKYCDRYNFDFGERRKNRIMILENIYIKEMEREIAELRLRCNQTKKLNYYERSVRKNHGKGFTGIRIWVFN